MGFDFNLSFDNDDVAHYIRIVDRLREGILKGELQPGQPLPSRRELSEELGVSTKTIRNCYLKLEAEDLIKMTQGNAPVVIGSKNNPRERRILPLPCDTSLYNELVSQKKPVKIIGAFSSNAPAKKDLPYTEWRRLTSKHTTLGSPAASYLRDPFGHSMLRSVLVRYVKQLHNVDCDEWNMAVVTEPRYAIYIATRLLVTYGDFVVIENPGSRWARRIFETHGATVLPVPIDDDGLCVDKLELIDKPVKIVYVTPSHHDPAGVVMSLQRREALVKWANERGAMVIEDHSDCQFRYESGKLPALQTFDTKQSVIYVSSFWKVLYDLALTGFAVFPNSMVESARSAIANATNDSVVTINQCALADFITGGFLDSQVEKMTRIYVERRKVLFDRLKRCFGERVQLAKESAALLHRIKLDVGLPDDKILECAEDVNLKLITMTPFYIADQCPGDFLIPFGSIEAADLEEKIQQFADRMKALEPQLTEVE